MRILLFLFLGSFQLSLAQVDSTEAAINQRDQDSLKTGLWVEYHENGEVKSKTYYKSGIPNGPFIRFFPSGKVSEEGVWIKHSYRGVHKEYFTNGCLKKESFYGSHGQPDSIYYYNPDCEVGDTVGSILTTKRGDSVIYAENYDHIHDSLLNYHWEDQRQFKFNTDDQIIYLYNTDGLLYKIVNLDTANQTDSLGRKQEFWVTTGRMTKKKQYLDSSIIRHGYYLNNRKTGDWYTYHPNGRVKSLIHFKNGRSNGPYKIYYKNGNLAEEGIFIDGKYDGVFKKFYYNGCLKVEMFYAKGKCIKPTITYKPDCVLKKSKRGSIKWKSACN